MSKPQIIRTAAGEELVVLPRRDYDALVARAGDAAAEDAATARLVAESDKAIAAGADIVLPETVFEAIEAGESPVRALRRFRAMTQAALAQAAGISQPYLSDIEAGRKTGTPSTLKALAAALSVPLDLLA